MKNIIELEKSIISIISEFKKGKLELNSARDLILVVTGHRTTANCKLDRMPEDCSIARYTETHGCSDCGHFNKD